MRSKCAVVLIYNGREITPEEHRKIAEAFIQCTDCVSDCESLEVYGLNGMDIARGVAIKAVNVPSTSMSQIDAAAKYIGEHFAASISAGIPTFAANISTTYVSIKMRGYTVLNDNEKMLVEAVELLSKDDAFASISNSIRKKYHITLGIVNAIKQIYDGICQGLVVM